MVVSERDSDGMLSDVYLMIHLITGRLVQVIRDCITIRDSPYGHGHNTSANSITLYKMVMSA